MDPNLETVLFKFDDDFYEYTFRQLIELCTPHNLLIKRVIPEQKHSLFGHIKPKRIVEKLISVPEKHSKDGLDPFVDRQLEGEVQTAVKRAVVLAQQQNAIASFIGVVLRVTLQFEFVGFDLHEPAFFRGVLGVGDLLDGVVVRDRFGHGVRKIDVLRD